MSDITKTAALSADKLTLTVPFELTKANFKKAMSYFAHYRRTPAGTVFTEPKYLLFGGLHNPSQMVFSDRMLDEVIVWAATLKEGKCTKEKTLARVAARKPLLAGERRNLEAQLEAIEDRSIAYSSDKEHNAAVFELRKKLGLSKF